MQSSSFDPDCHRVRRDGSYIYEEFLDTEGVDLKVPPARGPCCPLSSHWQTYAVGPEYVHVEARKSPTLDGVVQRDQEGKEIRLGGQLTPWLIAIPWHLWHCLWHLSIVHLSIHAVLSAAAAPRACTWPSCASQLALGRYPVLLTPQEKLIAAKVGSRGLPSKAEGGATGEGQLCTGEMHMGRGSVLGIWQGLQ